MSNASHDSNNRLLLCWLNCNIHHPKYVSTILLQPNDLFKLLVKWHETMAPKPLQNWRRCPGGQLKTWLHTIKANIESISNPQVYSVRHLSQDWLPITILATANHHVWNAFIQDAVCSMGGAGSTRPGCIRQQNKVVDSFTFHVSSSSFLGIYSKDFFCK